MKSWLKTSMLAISGLALFSTLAAAGANVVINEVVYDDAGGDDMTWVEILGDPGTDLTGYQLIGVNGNGGSEYKTVDLIGSIPASGYFVVGQDAGTPNITQVADTDFQNGPDSIVLRDAAGSEVDALGYGSFDPDEVNAGEGDSAQDVGADISLARCPDGSDTDDNATDFFADDTPTPGAENDGDCVPPATGACCFGDGGCAVMTGDDCSNADGTYQGDDTVCDPNPCDVNEPTDRELCEIAEDDVDGLPVLLGEYVRISGVVLNDSGTFSESNQDVKITDGNCCVTIFDFDITPALFVGDEVEVIGTVDFFNGLTEVSSPDLIVTVLSTGNAIPAPAEISTADLAANGEDYESCYIGLSCLAIVDGEWPAEGDNANVTVDDGSGPAVIRIDRDTDVDGSAAPVGLFSVVGLGGQFDSSAPYDEGYQMFPRSLADFVFDDPNCGPMPEGACCFADGSCVVTSRDDCAAQGGTYSGDDTLCDPNPCLPTPVIVRSWGEIKGQYKTR